MSARVYDSDEGEFVDFDTLAEWERRDKAKDERVKALEAENAELREEIAALKSPPPRKGMKDD